MADDALLTLADHDWTAATALPIEPTELTRTRTSVSPLELYEFERAGARVLHAANLRLDWLNSGVRLHFGPLNPHHRTCFVLSSTVANNVYETLFAHLLAEHFPSVLFIIDSTPVTTTFEKVTLQHIGLVRAAILDAKHEVANMSRAIQSALAVKPDKILLGFGPADGKSLSSDEMQLITDQLIGTVLNLTATNLAVDSSFQLKHQAELLVAANGNPYSRLINHKASSSSDSALQRKVEAERVLQFCRAVRAGTISTKLNDDEIDCDDGLSGERLELHQPDTRLNCSIVEWMKLNGLKARGLNIWTHLDIVSDRSGTFVASLNKQVASRTFAKQPGMVEVRFPDGRLKLVNFDRTRVESMLAGCGRLIKSVMMIKTSLLQRAIGFGPRLKMVIALELTNGSFELIKRILATSAHDMRKLTLVLMNHAASGDDEEQVPLELVADGGGGNREQYEHQVQTMFSHLKKRLSMATSNMRASALRRSLQLATMNHVGLTLVCQTLGERPDALFDIIRDADQIIKLDVIRVCDKEATEEWACFERQCAETNGIRVDIEITTDDESGELRMAIKKSTDLALIERELSLASEYSRQLVAMKEQYEAGLGDSTPPQPPVPLQPVEKVARPKSSPDIWIPSRDTLLTLQRKNTPTRSNTVWYPPSSLARAPKVNNVYPPPPPKPTTLAKSKSFYLDDRAKATTVYLTTSVKPPPIIPSCLKITNSETLESSSTWLKKNGLKGLKLNIDRWERRVTPGSKVFRGVLPTVRARHCELNLTELADVEALSYEAAKRYLKRVKWYLAEPVRLWFQSCLSPVLADSAVVLIDVSASSASWLAEAIAACRSLARHSTGRLNFIQFNDGIKVWQNQCYAMNQLARDDLSLWLQCIRPYGGSNMIDALRKAYLFNPKHIVIITDGIFELKPFNVYTEITSANEKHQVPLHFILPSQKYKEPKSITFAGYTSTQTELGAVVKMLKKTAKVYNGSLCIPPAPTSIALALNRIGHAQYVHDDQHFSPAVFKDCTEISLLMREMRRAQTNAHHCRQWIQAASSSS